VNKHEFTAGWTLLLEAYADQLKDLTTEERISRRDLYVKMLADMDGELWQEVVGVAIRSSKWFPRISELVEYATSLHRVLQPDAGPDAAFSHALSAVRRLDPLTLRPLSPVRDDVDRTVRSLGGWERLALVETDQIGWYRKEFLAAWEGANGLRARLQSTGLGSGYDSLDRPRSIQSGMGGGGQVVPSLGQGSSVTTTGEGVLDVLSRAADLGADQNHTWEGES
jgi:hypothetical protein